jgi:hypothetical protein
MNKTSRTYQEAFPGYLQDTPYLTPEQIATYSRLEALAQNISDAMAAFDLAVISSDVPDSVKIKCLEATSINTSGLAYRLHPQSEWMGGDSFKTRAPHITNER